MIYWVFVFMSFSVCIAAVIAVLRYRKMDPAFIPFILCIWVAGINEVISFLLAQNGLSNIANNNIYILAEGLLILWQFKKWDLFYRLQYLWVTLNIMLVITWIYEIHSWQSLQSLHYYYRLLCAVIVIICSINFNNRLIISHTKTLLKNPAFLISTGYIIYFTFKILTDTYWLYKTDSSHSFLYAVYYIIAWNNLAVNLIFIIALLWIPRKPNYINF